MLPSVSLLPLQQQELSVHTLFALRRLFDIALYPSYTHLQSTSNRGQCIQGSFSTLP